MVSLKATGATYLEPGQPLKCPRCDSKQAKSFKTMSRKFPKPEQNFSELFDSKKYENRIFRWENSYQCQKCGNEFVALFADDYQDVLQGRSPAEAQRAQKKKGFFGVVFSLLWGVIKWLIIIFILLCIIVAIYK